MTKECQAVAILPVKDLSRAKSRLAPVLSQEERRSLTLGMLAIVVEAAVRGCGEAWVVGGGPAVRRRAEALGARWLDDDGAGLNEALGRAMGMAQAQGRPALYLAADLPLASAEDVAELLRLSDRGRRVVLAPAWRDGGTNAILLPPAVAMAPALGEDSLRRHVEAVRALGLEPVLCRRRGLGLDVDIPTDLALLRSEYPGLVERLTSTAPCAPDVAGRPPEGGR